MIIKIISVIFINLFLNVNLLFLNIFTFILYFANKFIFKKKIDFYYLYLLIVGLLVVIKFVEEY